MPRLTKNPLVIANKDPDDFESAMPSNDTLHALTQSENFDFLGLDVGAGQAQTSVSAAKKIASQVAFFDGFPQGKVGDLDSLLGAPDLPVADLQKIFGAAIDGKKFDPSDLVGVVGAVFSAISSVISAVPVAGIVVSVATAFTKTLMSALDPARKRGSSSWDSPMVHVKKNDEDLARGILRIVPEPDWTAIFSPPGTSLKFYLNGLQYYPNTRLSGHMFGNTDDPPNPGKSIIKDYGKLNTNTPGVGALPGIADIVGKWQYPFKDGEGKPSNKWDDLYSFGRYNPAAVQVAAQLWALVRKNSRSAFKIRPGKITSLWADYYGALFEYGSTFNDTSLSNDNNSRMRAKIWHAARWLDTARNADEWETGGLDLFPVYGNDKKKTGYRQSNVPGWAANYPYTTDQLIRWIVQEQVTERLGMYLETLTVAYVPYNAPAFKEDRAGTGDLGRKLIEMRKLLLVHEAVSKVELDLIPTDTEQDREFRGAVEMAQKRPNKRLDGRGVGSSGPSFPPADSAEEKRIPIGGKKKRVPITIPAPGGLDISGLDSSDLSGSSTSAAAAITALAVVAGLAVALKGRRK